MRKADKYGVIQAPPKLVPNPKFSPHNSRAKRAALSTELSKRKSIKRDFLIRQQKIKPFSDLAKKINATVSHLSRLQSLCACYESGEISPGVFRQECGLTYVEAQRHIYSTRLSLSCLVLHGDVLFGRLTDQEVLSIINGGDTR